MKFTKEDACKDLMSKIPSTGETLQLSERSISEQVETLLPLLANEETELADFVASVLPIFKTADANIRANVSAQVREYKEKHPNLETPKPKKTQENEDDEVAKLVARIAELERKEAENEKAKTLKQRRSDIAAAMKEKGVKDDEWISDLLDAVNLDGESFDANEKAESYVKIYNKQKSKVNPKATPDDPTGGGGEDKYLDEVIKGASDYVKSQTLA